MLKEYLHLEEGWRIEIRRVTRLGGTKDPGIFRFLTGSTDGQTKIVREGDNGVAYGWNKREQKWDKIGEVVDGPEESNRQLFDGIQYDYVFDVDIGDGMPIRKLPYNRSDNPYDVADKWLLKENLPLSFREQVVLFILQNTGQNNVTFDASFRDPYTGSHAYVPGQPSHLSDISAKPTFKHIPKEKQNLSLTELNVSRLGAIVKILKDTSHYHSSKFADSDIDLLLNLLRSWPIAMIFPETRMKAGSESAGTGCLTFSDPKVGAK